MIWLIYTLIFLLSETSSQNVISCFSNYLVQSMLIFIGKFSSNLFITPSSKIRHEEKIILSQHLSLSLYPLSLSVSLPHPSFSSWTWPLYSDTILNLRDTVWGEIDKNNFIALPDKGYHSGHMPLKLCVPTWRRSWDVFHSWFKKGMISLWTFFWWDSGKVSGAWHHQLSGSNWSGVDLLVSSVLLPPGGGSVSANSSKVLLCVSLDGEPRPCPRAALFLSIFCFSCLASSPFPN